MVGVTMSSVGGCSFLTLRALLAEPGYGWQTQDIHLRLSCMLQETSSLHSGATLRAWSHMDPIEEFKLEAGTLPYLTLPYLTLPYLILPCLALPCLALPHLISMDTFTLLLLNRASATFNNRSCCILWQACLPSHLVPLVTTHFVLHLS